MVNEANLTSREREVAELIAWGATKKDVANKLFISIRTVENHTRNIFEKTGCTKVNELSAWYFCTHFHISFILNPLTRKVAALCLLSIFIIGELNHIDEIFCRNRRSRFETELISRRRQQDESEPIIILES